MTTPTPSADPVLSNFQHLLLYLFALIAAGLAVVVAIANRHSFTPVVQIFCGGALLLAIGLVSPADGSRAISGAKALLGR